MSGAANRGAMASAEAIMAVPAAVVLKKFLRLIFFGKAFSSLKP
jgi:hypothetical protein